MRNKDKMDVKVGLINKRDLKSPKFRIAYIFILILLWLGVIVCLVPPLWIISSAFKDVKEIHQIPPTFIPRSFHPEKLLIAWEKFELGLLLILCKFSKQGLNAITAGNIFAPCSFYISQIRQRIKP